MILNKFISLIKIFRHHVWCYECEIYVSEPNQTLQHCIELIKSKLTKSSRSQNNQLLPDLRGILVGTKCTHLQQSVDIQELRRVFAQRSVKTDSCAQCDEGYNPSLWLCLKCGTNLCGRLANGHALRHHKVNEVAK